MDPTDSGAASNLVEVPKPVAARIDWIDAAKAVSILLVVFHHSELISGAVGLKWGIYERLDALFGPIRMPLFFTVSGIFAAKAVSQRWRLLVERKVFYYFYLYGVWVLLNWLLARYALTPFRHPELGLSVRQLIKSWIVPNTGLWFLWTLGIYFILARLLAPLRSPVTLVAFVATTIIAGANGFKPAYHLRDAFIYGPFFLTGLWYGRSIVTQLPRHPMLSAIVGGGIYLALRRIAAFPDIAQGKVYFAFPLSISGLIFAVGLTVILCRLTVVRLTLSYLGRNTLPIYVLHGILITLMLTVVKAMPPLFGVRLWLPPLMVPLSVVGALAIPPDAWRFRYSLVVWD